MLAALGPSLAHAHGIAGNRFFVGTLTFDDPSVADEAIVPNFSIVNLPIEGGNAVDNRFYWAFTRLLTPFLQVPAERGLRWSRLARQLRRPDPDRRPVSLRKVAAALAERGYVASTGKPYEAAAVASMLGV